MRGRGVFTASSVSSAASFSPSALLFPFSDSGFALFSVTSASVLRFLFTLLGLRSLLCIPLLLLLSLFLLLQSLFLLFFLLFFLLLHLHRVLPFPLLLLLIFLPFLFPLLLLHLHSVLFPLFLLLPLLFLFPLLFLSFPSFPPTVSSSSLSSSLSSLDFASFQARSLGLSMEYQSLGHWFLQSVGSDFLGYVSLHIPHLADDLRRDFSSGSSLFLSALRSGAPLPVSSLPSSSLPPLPPMWVFSDPWSFTSPLVLSSSSFPLFASSLLSAFPVPPAAVSFSSLICLLRFLSFRCSALPPLFLLPLLFLQSLRVLLLLFLCLPALASFLMLEFLHLLQF